MNYWAKIRKAIPIGMAAIMAALEAIAPESEEGENISQGEFITIIVRSAIVAMKEVGGTLTNTNDDELVEIFKREMRREGLMG